MTLTGNMGFFDRFRATPKKKSGIQEYLDTQQILKEARTPTYDSTSAQYSSAPDKMDPIYDQFYLEYLADSYSHLRTVITKLASSTVSKGWKVEPIVDNPSEIQKEVLEKLLEDPSAGDSDISGMEFIKAMVRQIEIYDDCWVSVVYDYVRDESGELVGKQVKQLWIEDAKKMRFMTDRFGRFQDLMRMNPITRKTTNELFDPDDGTTTVPVAYVFEDDEEGEIPFARDEIIHFNKYSSSARLYGQSPILGLARKIETGLAIERYQNKIYRLERPPKGFLDIPNVDEKGLTRLGEYIAEETRRNPNFIPILSSREATSTAKFVPVMPNMDELMMLPYMDRINNDINGAYGVMPLVVGQLAGVGGLNSEGEQITIFDRTIRETQQCVEMGFLKPLLKLMGIDTWKIRFNDINEKDETKYLNNMNLKAQILTQMQNVGVEMDLDDDGNLVLPESPEVVRQDFLSSSQESLEAEEQSEPLDTWSQQHENSEESLYKNLNSLKK